MPSNENENVSTVNETIVTGKKYRVLKDKINGLWNRISFWTSANDVEFTDSGSLQGKRLNEVVTSIQNSAGVPGDSVVILDNNDAVPEGWELTTKPQDIVDLENAVDTINDNLTELASKALVYNEEDDTYGVIIDEQYYIIGKAGLKEVDMLNQAANYWSGVIGVFTSSGLGNTWHQSSQSGTFTPNTSITLSAKENSSGGSGVAYYCGYEIVTTNKMNLSNFNKLKITFSSRNFTDQYTRFQVALYDTDGVAHVLYNEKPDSNNLEFDISSYGLDCKIGVCVGAMEGGNRTASCTISAIKVVKETS